MAYASGKFSFGLCDYCGQRYPYNVLRKNWRGFKVCPDDYEPKEPQLEPLKYRGDAIALLQPRPDRVEPLDVYVGQPGYTYFQSIGSANNTINMQPFPGQDSVQGAGRVGSVTIRANAVVSVSGVQGSGQVGTVTLPNTSVNLMGGVSGTGGIGNAIIPDVSVDVFGVVGTGSANSVLVSLVTPAASAGVLGSGSIGNVVIPDVSFEVTGVEGSGEISDPSVTT